MSINKQFKMRRNGGEVGRASETSDLAYSNNQVRTMQNMGMADSGMNYGTPIAKHEPGHEEKPKKKKLGTEGMTPEEKLEYYRKQKENSKNKKTSNISMGIGSNRSSGANIIG